jgi:putative hydrolase of the HAD superfamily
MRIPGKTIVFDYGEVISVAPSESDRAELVKLAGVDAPTFWTAYWLHRDALDMGTMNPQAYWREIGHDLDRDWTDAEVYQLWLSDYRSWLTIEPGVLDLLVELKAGNTRMALLSNAGRDFSSYYRDGVLGSFFDGVFVSGELGTLKPGPAIFETLLAVLGVGPDEVVFVDNRRVNVEGAEAVGIPGYVFTTAHELRSFLQGLVE